LQSEAREAAGLPPGLLRFDTGAEVIASVEYQEIPARLEPCLRGCEKLRPILYIYAAPNKPGLLVVPLTSGAEIKVRLARRYVNTLLLVLDCWNEQSDAPDLLRGFSTAEELGEMFAGMPGSRGVVSAKTVASHIRDIRDAIRVLITERFGADAVARFYVDPFETSPQRGLGYRVGRNGLVVERVACGGRAA